LYVTDRELQLVLVSDKLLKLAKKRADELIGRHLLEVFPEIEFAAAYQAQQHALHTGKEIHLETASLIKGRTIALEVYPRQTGLIVCCRDIDQRKRLEQSLGESQDRLKRAQELAGIATWEWDLATGAVRWAPEMFGLLGLDPQADADDLHGAWLRSLHPEDRASADAIAGRSRQNREAFCQEFRIIRDGAVRWIMSCGAIADLQMLGVCVDITERKQWQAELDASRSGGAITHLSAGIVVHDGTTIIKVSPQFAEMFGYTKEELTGAHLAKLALLVPPHTKRAELAGVVERTAVRKDGARLRIEYYPTQLVLAGRDVHIALVRNVSNQQCRQPRLAEYEERLLLAIEAGRLIAWERRPDSDKVLRYSSRTATSPTATLADLRVLVHPDDADRVKAAYQAALRTSGAYQAEYRARGADGTWRWFDDRGIVHRDQAGHPVRVVGIAQDITERKAVEQALRESEERFRTMLEALPHFAFVLQADGSIEYANARLGEYIGKTLRDLEAGDDIFHPDDWAQVRAVRQVALAKQTAYQCEARLRRHDGAYRWHAIDVRLLHREDQAACWLGTAVDIDDISRANEILERRVGDRTGELESTNRSLLSEIEERKRAQASIKESEERFRNLYNRTPIALHSSDPNAKIIDVNDGWLQLFGYSREEVLGRSPADFMTEESARRYREKAWPDMLTSAGTIRTFEYQFVKKSGEVFDASLSARGEWDGQGNFVRTWAATADITAQKHAEAQLRQVQKMEAVGQLTGGVAHDFNNLLMVILGNLETARRAIARSEPDRDGRLDRLLDTAMSGAQRAATLTQRLLAFARRQALDPKPINVNNLIAGMAEFFQRSLPVTVGFKFVGANGLWNVEADPTELEAAIINLVVNARDAMSAGGELTIETANVCIDEEYPQHPPDGQPGPYVVITVSDTGSGMSAKVLSRAFEPFFTTKPPGQGTGLGLSQVYGFINQSGGHVKITSEPGRGTTAKVYLPRFFGPLAGSDPQVQRRPALGFGQRILVVEDNASVREHVVASLRELNYEVLEASDAEGALAVVSRCANIDLVLTDVVLPGLNGAQFADALRAMLPFAKVLYMTGYSREAIVQHGRLSPGIELVQKPVTMATLSAKIKKMLDGGHLG
jgi:PAS domain S-box-containing protein